MPAQLILALATSALVLHGGLAGTATGTVPEMPGPVLRPRPCPGGPTNPCGAARCEPGYVCVPDPKQCVTTPCPQHACVPARDRPTELDLLRPRIDGGWLDAALPVAASG